MAWLFLILGGLFEASWPAVLKASHGHPRWWPTIVAFVLSLFSFGFMNLATARLPLSTCYPIWTAIGTVGATILGLQFFSENTSPFRLGCIALIVLGVVGLRWTAESGS